MSPKLRACDGSGRLSLSPHSTAAACPKCHMAPAGPALFPLCPVVPPPLTSRHTLGPSEALS